MRRVSSLPVTDDLVHTLLVTWLVLCRPRVTYIDYSFALCRPRVTYIDYSFALCRPWVTLCSRSIAGSKRVYKMEHTAVVRLT